MDAAVFTHVALVTSLGHDAATTAAAARAGIVRASTLPYLVDNVETKEPEPVTGHAVSGLAVGFEGRARLLRLAELALDDLLQHVSLATLRSAHWLIALPAPLPTTPPPDLSDPESPPPPPPAVGPPRLEVVQMHRLIEQRLGAPVPAAHVLSFAGRTGVIRALGHARRLCAQGEVCVVGTTDTLVDPDVLATLHAHGRLQVGGVGLVPGEASAFVVVERGGGRPADVLGRMGAGALAHEPGHLYSGQPALGQGLAAAAAQLPSREPVWPLSDCNGEPFRSSEWGHAAVRDDVLRTSLDLATYPATAVGDTGAASTAVGLGLALRAFARGYAPRPTALLLAADALGGRGVLTIHAP